MGGSLDPSSAGLRVMVSRRAAGSTASTRPATFCPSLNFLCAFLVPLSDMCSVGTTALSGGGRGGVQWACQRSGMSAPTPTHSCSQ